MSLILMSVSQLITVNHIIDPQSWVFLRIVVFLLPPKQSSTIAGGGVGYCWFGGLILVFVLFCFI